MESIIIGIIAYFITGLLALLILDISTKRVRNRVKSSADDTQLRLAVSGNYVGVTMAVAMILFALWLFWPVAIFSALISPFRGE